MKSIVGTMAVAVAMGFALNGMTMPARADQPWTEWHNALAPQGTPSAPLTLAANGQSDYVIVIPAAPSTLETTAAGQLQYWLQQMTGVTLPIVTGTATQGKLAVSVGRTTLLSQSGLPAASVDLGDEGYGIAVQGTTLFLWGGTSRGVFNAVYTLLEEDLGWRCYTLDHYRIPTGPVLTVAPVPRTYQPSLRMRDPFYSVALNELWSVFNRSNAPTAHVREEWGGHIDYDGPFTHTTLSLVPPAKYYDSHPEYFMMNANGNRVPQQLCLTNPDVRDIITQKTLQTLAANPNVEIAEISKMDTSATCLCPNCKALNNAEGSGMGSLLPLLNHVAEQIEPRYPNVLISTLAYFDTLYPPATIRPRHNIVIRVCNTEALWGGPFLPMAETPFGPLLASWAAIHDKLFVWDYNVNFHNYLAPMPNMHTIAANVPFAVANNVTGYMTQGGNQSTCERDTMRAWVIAKLMWDPSRDGYQMQQDFIWGHYGNAAGKVAEYYDLLYAQYTLHASKLKKVSCNFPMDTIFLTADFLNAADAIFDQAEALAENNSILNRVQRERLSIMYVWLERGPEFTGSEYGSLIDRFETIARREGVNYVKKGANLDAAIQEYRDEWQQSRYTLRAPSPANAAIDVSMTTQLTWTVWDTANVNFKIYFGSTNPPPLQVTQTSLSFDPGRLPPLTTWFWQVVIVAEGQDYPGPVWRFTTRRFPDYDADGDVDQEDFGHIQICLTGSAAAQPASICQDAKLDDDDDVDSSDLAIFLQCWSGPSQLADLTCTN